MLIHTVMPQIMNDIGAIGKTHKNTQGGGYDFRSIDDTLSVIQPVLVKHCVSLATNCRDIQHHEIVEQVTKHGKTIDRRIYRTTLVMVVEFFAADGSTRKFSSVGEGMDYGGDKATNKAMSAAFKYAMFLGLAIPIEAKEIDDSDRTPEQKTSDDLSCTAEHISDVKSLAKLAGMNKGHLIALLEPKGIKKPSDMTGKQAESFIRFLQKRIDDGVPF